MELNENASSDALPEKRMTNKDTVCAPGCDCGSTDGSSKFKITITLLVILAVVGIISYKLMEKSQITASDKGFAPALAGMNAGIVKTPDTSDNAEPDQHAVPTTENMLNEEHKTVIQQLAKHKNPAAKNSGTGDRRGSLSEEHKTVNQQLAKHKNPAAKNSGIGDHLGSLSELNKVAMNQDAVFIFIPAKTGKGAGEPTRNAVLSAANALKTKSINVGSYTLNTSTRDYSAISSQVHLPAILVACKGRGIAAVSGDITETKLLQAFMAANRARGSCCSSGSKSNCK